MYGLIGSEINNIIGTLWLICVSKSNQDGVDCKRSRQSSVVMTTFPLVLQCVKTIVGFSGSPR